MPTHINILLKWKKCKRVQTIRIRTLMLLLIDQDSFLHFPSLLSIIKITPTTSQVSVPSNNITLWNRKPHGPNISYGKNKKRANRKFVVLLRSKNTHKTRRNNRNRYCNKLYIGSLWRKPKCIRHLITRIWVTEKKIRTVHIVLMLSYDNSI